MRKFKLFALLLGLFSLVGLTQVLKAEPVTVDVVIKYYNNGVIDSTKEVTGPVNQGDTLEDNPTITDATFMFWVVNGAVRRDLPQNLTIRVPSSLSLEAHFASKGNKVAVFLDSNLKYLTATYFTGDSIISEPSLNALDKPLSSFKGWALMSNYDEMVDFTTHTLTESKSFFVAKYALEETLADVVVSYNGVDTTHKVNDVVTLTTGIENPVWKDGNDQVIGYGQTLKLTVFEKMAVTVSSGDGDVVSDYVILRGPFNLRENHQSYIGSFNVSGEVLEYGFILEDDTKAPSKSYNEETNEFLSSFSTVQPKEVYVVYLKEGVQTLTKGVPSPTYSVTINGEQGTFLTVPEDLTNIAAGSEVSIKLSKEGFILESFLVDGIDKLTEVEDGVYTFTVTGNHEIDYTWTPSIKHIRTIEVGQPVSFKGIVTRQVGDNTQVADATGAITLYQATVPEGIMVGDQVAVSGTKSNHFGLMQVTSETVTVLSSGNTTPVFDVTTLDGINDRQSQHINIQGLNPQSISGDGRNLTVKLGELEIVVRSNNSSGEVYDAVKDALHKESINLTNVFVDWYDNKAQFLVEDLSQIEVIDYSDEFKVAFVEEYLEQYDQQDYQMGDDVPFITTHSIYGGVIEYTYSPEGVVVDGKFVALNEQDTIVNATASITIGDEMKTYDFLFTIKYVDMDLIMDNEIAYEDFESLTPTNSYTGTVTKGNWVFEKGNVVDTSAPVYGNRHVLIRVAKDTTNTGYATYKTLDEQTVSKISFQAKYTHSSIVAGVQFSNDGGVSWGAIVEIEGLSTTYSTEAFVIKSNISEANRFRFVVNTSSQQSSHRDFLFDDVRIYEIIVFTKAGLDLNNIVFEQSEFDVATNLVLPTVGTSHGSTISWASSHPEIISSSGVMTLPETTTEVTLTATANHTDGSTATKKFTFTVVGVRSRVEEQLALIVMPSQTDTDLVLPLKTEDNKSNISWTSNNTSVITNDGVVTRQTEDVTVTMTATVIEGGFTITKTFDVIVIQEGGALPEPETFTETFDDMTMSGSSYGDGSHKGTNDQLFAYTDARGDQTLNGKALLLRDGSLTTTFTEGLLKLEFDYKRAFTGTKSRKFEIYINDVKVDEITVNATSDDVAHYSKEFTYKGNVILEIKGTGAQKLIDNLAWTTNP